MKNETVETSPKKNEAKSTSGVKLTFPYKKSGAVGANDDLRDVNASNAKKKALC